MTARANLAASYWQAGRTGEAIALLERVLADSERLLGEEHPDTLTARVVLRKLAGRLKKQRARAGEVHVCSFDMARVRLLPRYWGER